MTKIIFCFDGTCNDPEDCANFVEDGSVSNVLKLHAIFGGKLNPPNAKNAAIPDQHSFYYSGVGTRGSWFTQKFNAIFAPADGDLHDILDEAKSDLGKHFRDGDEIYIFGFSRGAAIARMFASTIQQAVTFLGVFDTVAATKGSLDLNPDTYPASGIVFENGSIGQHIKQAVHLVSIDEKRLAFQPTLFNKDSRVTEVWFAGVHSDVGGGYWFDGLSDVTLDFMLACVKDKLVELMVNDIDYDALKIDGAPEGICCDDININPLPCGKLHEQKRSGMKAKTLAPRFIRVNINDQPSSDDTPIIHHSVSDRFHAVTEYRPYSLRNISFRVMEEDGKISEEKTGIIGI